MIFEFDPAKDSVNVAKHGLSLLFGRQVFDDPAHIILASFRPIDGEDRYKAVGLIEGKFYTVVYN
ncbi:MAG: BrnT family toxin, partial [Chakrabartia sp.]